MIFLCIALVWLIGFASVRLFLPAPLRWSIHNILLFSLGAGVGIGIASSLYFLVLALFGPRLPVLASVEVAALLAVIAVGIVLKRQGTLLEWAPGPATPWYLNGLLLVAIAIAATVFIVGSLVKPHGEWDAWSIWNLRARFLFRGGEFWRDAFSSQTPWSHPDYPLMLPGIVAMCWTLARAESTMAPIAIAMLFTFGAVGVLISTVGILRGKTQALIAGLLLLGSVSFFQMGAFQYADVPLSFSILATLALLCLQDRHPDDPRFTVLAGLTAGFAAWTKNEGLLFIAVLVVARAVALLRFGNRASILPQFLRLGAGLVAPLAVVAFFKARFAPPNDLLGTQPRQIVAHLADLGRWMTTVQGFLVALFRIGSFLIPVLLVLALYWYLLRFKVEEQDRISLATALLAIGLMLAGDFAVYVLFPGDVAWQVTTSIERLLLQVWPAGLLAFFLAVNVPQLVPAPATVDKKRARHAATH